MSTWKLNKEGSKRQLGTKLKVFSYEDLERLKKEFKNWDKNADGKVTKEDLRKWLPINASESMISEMLCEIGDANGNNEVLFEEYVKMNA